MSETPKVKIAQNHHEQKQSNHAETGHPNRKNTSDNAREDTHGRVTGGMCGLKAPRHPLTYGIIFP